MIHMRTLIILSAITIYSALFPTSSFAAKSTNDLGDGIVRFWVDQYLAGKVDAPSEWDTDPHEQIVATNKTEDDERHMDEWGRLRNRIEAKIPQIVDSYIQKFPEKCYPGPVNNCLVGIMRLDKNHHVHAKLIKALDPKDERAFNQITVPPAYSEMILYAYKSLERDPSIVIPDGSPLTNVNFPIKLCPGAGVPISEGRLQSLQLDANSSREVKGKVLP